jgi:hypothetical protein
MGAEKTVSIAPPATTAAAVKKYRQALAQSLDDLKATIPALALAAARRVPGAQDELAALRVKIENIEFEIEQNAAAYRLAEQQDGAAFAEWRAAVQQLEPAEIIGGISKEQCPGRCLRGLVGGCILAGGDAFASGCLHPIIEKHLFSRDSSGKRTFLLSHNPRAVAVFGAACEKLKARGEFA